MNIADSYFRTMTEQDSLINDMAKVIDELNAELLQRPKSIKKEHWLILYSMEIFGPYNVYRTTPEEADDIIKEFVETGKITLLIDFAQKREVISPYSVAKTVAEKPITKQEIRTVSGNDEKGICK